MSSEFYFRCKSCPLKFLSSKFLRNHSCVTHHLSPNILKKNEEVKDNEINDETRRIVHEIKETTQLGFSSFIPSESEYKTGETDNLSINQIRNQYVCTFCPKILDSKYSLDIHLKIHEFGPKMSCKLSNCDKIFPNKTNMWNHMVSEHDAKEKDWKGRRGVCVVCNKVKLDLKTHMFTHSNEKKLMCTQCPKLFKDKKGFQLHIKVHQGIFDHECSECKKKFVSKTALKQHLVEQHTTETNFKCDQCVNEYKNKYKLAIHMTSHTGEKQFQCREGCNKMFRIRKVREEHENKHKGIKHKCKQCTKTYTQKSTLQDHTVRCHGTRNHLCNVCGKAFFQPYEAKRCKHSNTSGC